MEPEQEVDSDIGADRRRTADSIARWEARIARLEAEVRAHAERLTELQREQGTRKQRALLFRLVLLALLLAAFFWVRTRGGAT